MIAKEKEPEVKGYRNRFHCSFIQQNEKALDNHSKKLQERYDKIERSKNINELLSQTETLRHTAAVPADLKSRRRRATLFIQDRSQFDKQIKSLKLNALSPRYMNEQMYTEMDRGLTPRYKTPCVKLRSKNLQNTYHDPADGKIVNLNSYLGLDRRGTKKLSILKRKLSRENLDGRGELIGRGLLSPRSNKVNLEPDA